MTTRFRTTAAASVALVLTVSIGAAGCGRYSLSSLKAQKAFKEANDRYKAQDWKGAADKYEYSIAQNPDLTTVYFFLGNSYDNLFKPSRMGEAENDAYMQKAIENYKKAAELDKDKAMRKLALEYLVAAYGAEKLNQPEQAEPILQQMIQMEPNEPTGYFYLSKIYEDAGRYEDAEQTLMRAREAKPNDPAVYTQIANFYNRQGEFDSTMEALHKGAELDAQNPQAHHTVAAFYWEKSYKDHRLPKDKKLEYIQKGIEAEDKALAINPDYSDALTYKNLLLRMQGNEETDMQKRQKLYDEADKLRSRAIELNKKKASGQ